MLCPRFSALLLASLTTLSCLAKAHEPPPAEEGSSQESSPLIATTNRQLAALLEAAIKAPQTSTLIRESVSSKPSDHATVVSLEHGEIAAKIVRQPDYEPLLATATDAEASLTSKGKRALGELENVVERHGVRSLRSQVVSIKSLLEERTRTENPLKNVALDARERVAVRNWLEETRPGTSMSDYVKKLGQALTEESGPAPRLARLADQRRRQIEEARQRTARLELKMVDALLLAAWKLRYQNEAWLHEEQADASDPGEASEGGEASDQNVDSMSRRRAALFEGVRPYIHGEKKIESFVDELAPPFAPYRVLTDVYTRYRRFVAEGGWVKLPPSVLGWPEDAPPKTEALLATRLNAENWLDETAPDRAALTSAFRRFQRSHDLEDDGVLGENSLRELNRSALEKREEIRLILERWRESRIGADSHYVHVNVAGGFTRVVDDGEELLRFRAVVGKGEKEWEPELGRKVWKGETPLFSDEIEYITFNPYWWIPDSIVWNELVPRKKEDPGFFSEMGYRWVEGPRGEARLRQDPGPKNAMGQMKFLFPNKHAVYLHDTPQQRDFDATVRNFSHGCVRVEKPREFARVLMVSDGKGTPSEVEDRIEELLQKDEPTRVYLDEHVPIHIEYFTVSTDENQHPVFYEDIYDTVRPRLSRIVAREEGLRQAFAVEAGSSSVTENIQRP